MWNPFRPKVEVTPQPVSVGDKVSAIRQSGGDNGTLYVTEPV
jgi:hypothetical protein